MHQTFYIDTDEEISSVIDRLNKSSSAMNYFVVPKRALFLQSIVNLKLLKREADKLGKHLVLVTQDEIGSSMAQRSGLEVAQTIEGLDPTDINSVINSNELSQEEDLQETEPVVEKIQDKKSRLKAVGSSNYYDTQASSRQNVHDASIRTTSPIKKVPINGLSIANRSEKIFEKLPAHNPIEAVAVEKKLIRRPSGAIASSLYANKIDPGKERILEKMFSSKTPPKNEGSELVLNVSSLSKKIFIGFVTLCFFVFAGIATYLFLPSANIIITPNIVTDKIDSVINGGVDISQVENSNMPIRVINKEEKISSTFDVVGGSAGVGKKARGTVVIYNEFSNASQPLIATTRLESPDGKIFRLVKNIVVPGTTILAGETKPGAIEAEVTADQAGSDFNITASSFTVPGFKGGPKFEKFYAKSTTDFIGGSSEGGSSPGAVSQQDLDNAKREIEAKLKEQIVKGVTAELGVDEVLLEQAQQIVTLKAVTSAKIGDMVDTFSYDASASIRALVFSKKDVEDILKEKIKNNQNLKDATWVFSKIEYGTVVPDFEKNTLELKIYGEITITPNIDVEKIKKDLLGKKDDQLEAVLKNYSSIKNVNVEFQPTIVSRIPQYAFRVTIEVQNNVE